MTSPAEYLIKQYDKQSQGVVIDTYGRVCMPGNPCYRALIELLPDDELEACGHENCTVCQLDLETHRRAQESLNRKAFRVTLEEQEAARERTHP
jgi:hypothetical protein